ncbi:hypothetical protein AB9P05_02220 [Roseivirga sp. BDSF3-8]|uniref:hypothetical protein n=1 Tax=Roseivirga sp. BDSF3-8 TaxID=3241598 RepID=UPI003531B012
MEYRASATFGLITFSNMVSIWRLLGADPELISKNLALLLCFLWVIACMAWFSNRKVHTDIIRRFSHWTKKQTYLSILFAIAYILASALFFITTMAN